MENNQFVQIDFIKAKDLDYKQAIKLGVLQLVKHNKATIELYDAILDSVNQHGFYFILAPKLALAHAKPDKYCKQAAISLIVFDQPIWFSDQKRHQVQILVTLSTPNNQAHMDYIVWFAKTFQQELINKLCEVKSLDEIYKILGENK